MAVRNLEAVQQLSGLAVRAESRPGRIGPISLGAKQTGERRAGNPHAAFDVAGIGNVAWSRCCDTRRRKGETTGNTNFDLNRRASPRPYLGAPGGETPLGDSTRARMPTIEPARWKSPRNLTESTAIAKTSRDVPHSPVDPAITAHVPQLPDVSMVSGGPLSPASPTLWQRST